VGLIGRAMSGKKGVGKRKKIFFLPSCAALFSIVSNINTDTIEYIITASDSFGNACGRKELNREAFHSNAMCLLKKKLLKKK